MHFFIQIRKLNKVNLYVLNNADLSTDDLFVDLYSLDPLMNKTAGFFSTCPVIDDWAFYVLQKKKEKKIKLL